MIFWYRIELIWVLICCRSLKNSSKNILRLKIATCWFVQHLEYVAILEQTGFVNWRILNTEVRIIKMLNFDLNGKCLSNLKRSLSNRSFNLFFQIVLSNCFSNLSFKVFFQIILSNHSFKSFFQIILSNHSFKSFFPILLWNLP